MKISLHNTLLRRKQEFVPIDENNVRMYVCGPTVYDRAHLGNAKTSVVFDVLYRFLCQVYGKDHVTYVSNITDVDDKILNKHKETGKSIREITEQTFQWYLDDMKKLNVLNPNHRPRATEYIQEMIELVKLLLQNGHAYEAEGHVLFSVDSMPDYGFLSGRSMKEMLAGARIEVADYKKNPADFILWKPSEADQPGWDSPWGYGRPGWHLECSCMSQKYLGDTFDIHGGGLDLQFPHHECEIAQSTAAYGHEAVRYWMHNNMITINGQKMGKSLGNFITLDQLFSGQNDVLEQAYSPMTVRFFILQAHYRSPLDFSNEALKAAEKGYERLMSAVEVLDRLKPSDHNTVSVDELYAKCFEAIDDDLNTPILISQLFEGVRMINSIAAGKEQIDTEQLDNLKKIVSRLRI